MDAARKNAEIAREEWVLLTRAVELLGVGSKYLVAMMALRGELEHQVQQPDSRVLISRKSIDAYLARKADGSGQLVTG